MTDNDNAVFKWNQGILNSMIGLCYKKSQYITIFNLRNLQKLMESSDFSAYQNKSQIIERVKFIKRTLVAKLEKKYADESIIISYATEDTSDVIVADIVNSLPKYKQLNHSEIKYLNEMIEDRLKFGLITSKYIERMGQIYETYQSGDYTTYAEFMTMLESMINDYNVDSRQIKSDLNNQIIRFNNPNIKERVKDILDRLGTTQSIIRSGTKMLNDILAPGYRGGKLYTYAALPANFKSGLLLKTALDCIKYNASTYRGKKDSHTKAVLYFTMENTMDETFERIYNMAVDKESIIDHDVDYLVGALERAQIINNPDMELITVYRPNRSITTKDIQIFIETLDEENVEVVMLCFDYIKRIRPYEYASNEKEELKNVTNELKQIGIDFDIPIVTAAQLNRNAATIINDKVRSGSYDALKDIDSSTIGSAWEVVENSDLVIMLNIQRRKKDEKLFLSFLCAKQRYSQPDIMYFNQPFEEDTFNLVDDIFDEKPKGLVSLKTDFDDIDMDTYVGNKGRKNHLQPGEDVSYVDDTFNLKSM